MYHCVHLGMYCVAKNLYSTLSSTLKTAITPTLIQYLHGNGLSPSSLNVGLPLHTTSKIKYTPDHLCVPTTQCYTKEILWTGLLANVFKNLASDDRLVNHGLLTSVTLAHYGSKFHVWQDIKSLK